MPVTGARRGSCALVAIAAVLVGGALVWVVGGPLVAIGFMAAEDWLDVDADKRLPRGGPADVLLKPEPRLVISGLEGAPLTERRAGDGWERDYASPWAADGRLTVRLDAARSRVQAIVLAHPKPRHTWEDLAARRGWGPPAATTDEGDRHVSTWVFPVPGGAKVEAVARWHGARPGTLDEVRWTRTPAP